VSKLTYGDINDDVLGPLSPPRRGYWLAMAVMVTGVLWALGCWCYQVQVGMGISGLNHPVGWATYITNFVFWVGIAHSGTLISAILHLVRSRWRTAVSRSAEAMTVFAVMTAGLFPMIHLGRVWVFYYIIPYPSERQLWPDFLSPLIWDVCAVGTYFTVSSIFWFVGLIPDLAAARDRCARLLGPRHWRSRLYRVASLGWTGAGSQWRHYGRGYLFFAALATPLVISVHSVVSWDFAMALLPGWHTTIFAPYFVAGAIHSGLAMVLTLVIPMRRWLKLQRVITVDHFEAVALTMLVTTAIVGYAYVIEPFISWYSGDPFERQFAWWRATGWIAPLFWALAILNVVAPLAMVFRKVRRSLKALFIISILVNIGMWLERFVIIVGSTAHDFMPHNWLGYYPRPVEVSITVGAFAFFLFWFLGFTKMVPTVALGDVKADLSRDAERHVDVPRGAHPAADVRKARAGVLAVFAQREDLLAALRKVRASPFRQVDTYSPIRLHEAEEILGRGAGPVRYWTLIGAVSGCVGGFALAIGSALVNSLIAGGKHPVSIVPYCIVAFEGTILVGVLANLAGVLYHARLGRPRLPAWHDERFTRDRFGLFVACELGEAPAVQALVAPHGPESVRVVGPEPAGA
jgi:molybdopterin-containing oxidoreductase family membrane subunit